MQVCNFARFLVYSLGSGNNLIKIRHAHHIKATAQLLIFLLHHTLGVNLSILLMNLDLSYLFKLVAKLQLNGSCVEITVDFVINMESKHPVFNSVRPWSSTHLLRSLWNSDQRNKSKQTTQPNPQTPKVTEIQATYIFKHQSFIPSKIKIQRNMFLTTSG